MSGFPLEVVLPWTPCAVPVNRWTRAVDGKVLKSRRYRRGLDHASGLAMVAASGIRPDADQPFRVEVAVYLPDRRRRDLDGLAKLPLDALEGWVYEDDYQVKDLRLYVAGLDRDEPRLELVVEPMEEA